MRRTLLAAAALTIAVAPIWAIAAPTVGASPCQAGTPGYGSQACMNCYGTISGPADLNPVCYGNAPTQPASNCSRYTGALYKSCCDDRRIAGLPPC